MRLLPYGDTAVLIELDSAAQVRAWSAAAATLPMVTEVVPAARTVLVIAARPGHTIRDAPLRANPRAPDGQLDADLPTLRRQLQALHPHPIAVDEGPLVEVTVDYDGADLADVARLTGLSPAQVVERHTRRELTAAFSGFAPGFAYLTGLDPELDVPRLPTPRTRVPAGSVAIADAYSAVYPRDSPGGWRLLGRTEVALFDAQRDPPALLTPGTRVRFLAR